MKSTGFLFDGDGQPKPTGWVSDACRLHWDGDRTIVAIHGQPIFVYGPQDPTLERLAWVQVRENGWATYAQIAAAELFDRTGNQENYFKYVRREYDMDAKGIYKTEDVLDETLTHPNPAYVSLAKKKSELAAKRRAKLAKYAADLLAATPEEVARSLASRGKRRLTQQIAALDESIRQTEETMAKTPCRESVSKAGYKKLNEQARAFQYGFKMTADEIERKLVDMVSPHYPNASKEGRKFIAAALQTQGDIRLEPGKIVVRLRPQSSPKRNRALNALLEQINLKKAVYPGSHRVIFFEPSPDPVQVFHSP
jgi:hypothetical protein